MDLNGTLLFTVSKADKVWLGPICEEGGKRVVRVTRLFRSPKEFRATLLGFGHGGEVSLASVPDAGSVIGLELILQKQDGSKFVVGGIVAFEQSS